MSCGLLGLTPGPRPVVAGSDGEKHRDRITFINRYVHDRELDAHLRGADAVVLPYRRSSLSGPLHVAMGYGLPIVITNVGGNAEAADGYEGVVLANPEDPDSLRQAIRSSTSSTVGGSAATVSLGAQ